MVVLGPLFTFMFTKTSRLFFIALFTEVGNGARTHFWSDRWIHGQQIADIAPQVFDKVNKRRVQRRSVQEALTDHSRVSDIQGALTASAISEFLVLWDLLSEVSLQPDVEDTHIWRFSLLRPIRPRPTTYIYDL
jgi:hypothetical protein